MSAGRRRHSPSTGPDTPGGNGAAEPGYAYNGDQPHQAAPFISGKCGTYAGWNIHQRNHEPKCEPCKAAHREYMQAWRLRTGRVKTIRVRPSAGLLQLLAQPPGPAEDRWA